MQWIKEWSAFGLVVLMALLITGIAAYFKTAQAEPNVQVSAARDGISIQRGMLGNIDAMVVYGQNKTVGTALETLWDGSAAYTYPSAAAVMHISSSAAGDTQVYAVYGLDADYALQTVTVTAVGQTETVIGTGETWIRIFRVVNTGATDNAGTVYVYEDDTVAAGVPQTASKIKSQITIGYNVSLMALYTIPAGFTGYITYVAASSEADKSAEVQLVTRAIGSVFLVRAEEHIYRGRVEKQQRTPSPISEKTDIELRALVSATTSAVSGTFDLILIPN